MTMIESLRTWLNETTPRWVTVAMVTWIVASTLLYGEDLMDRQERHQEVENHVNCVQRVASRSDVRGAFIDVYNYIDENNEDPNATDRLRARLDLNYPPLYLEDCER